MLRRQNFLKNFSLGLYVYTLFIILWGAWVRISKSGDGCGDSWPLCGGKFVPEAKTIATWIEFSHRLTTGLFGLLVIYLLYYVFKHFKAYSTLKKITVLVFVFTITEALIGALLVKMGLVAGNDSFLRLIYMSVHQLNSVFLSGFIGLIYLMAKKDHLKSYHMDKSFFIIAALFLLIMILGPLASLSTTLYPSESLFEGMAQELDPGQHWIVRWRSLHPILATIIGGGLFYYAFMRYQKSKAKEDKVFVYMLLISVLFGIATLLLIYPLWMKLGHLALAHLLWLSILNLGLRKN